MIVETTYTIMRPDRTAIVCSAECLALAVQLCPWLVRAKDGIYLPSCDLAQYEAGRRPFRSAV